MSARAAARETTTVSGTSPAAATSCELGRQARERVEHDPARLQRRLGRQPVGPRGELRVVRQRGADADDHRVDRGAPAVGEAAALLAADPLRVAGAGGDLAVERHRRLEQHPRAPDARVLAKGLVEQPRRRRQLAVGDHDLDALVAQDPQAAPEAFSVGSSEATTTRLIPARRIASVHGGVLPSWQQGSSDT